MKKLIILSLLALILSPFNPIFHVADAASIIEAINPNDNGETIQDPINEQITPAAEQNPCNDTSFSTVSGDPCPAVERPGTPVNDIEPVVIPPVNPCVSQAVDSVSTVGPCPVTPRPGTPVNDIEPIVIPLVNPCVSQAVDSVSTVGPCPATPRPGRPGNDIEVIVNPIPSPCVNPAIDSVSTVTPCPAAPRPDRPVNDTETEGVQVIEVINPTPPTGGGGGGGGGFIFPPTTTPTTTPTTPVNPDQQVLGEQIFADNTPLQQVLGQQAETSVLGEKVTSPAFPKTGAAPITSNSIMWQLALTLVLSSVLIISLNQKKTIIVSK